MDPPFMVEQDTKPLGQMRRSFLPEDVASQQYNHDVKIPLPQAKYFPPRLSMRGIPLKAYGTLSNDTPSSAPEVHLSEPRYLLQDVSYDDKRFKNYYGYAIQLLQALNPAGGSMIGLPNANQSLMNGQMPGSVASGPGSIGLSTGMAGININVNGIANMQMVPGMVGSGLGPGLGRSGAQNCAQNDSSTPSASNSQPMGSGVGAMPLPIHGNVYSGLLMQHGLFASVPTSVGTLGAGLATDGDSTMTSTPMSMNGMVPHPQQQSSFPGKLEELNGPVSPILPAQMLQIKEDEQRKTEAENQIQSKCSRCQKEFKQSLIVSKDLFLGKLGAEPKIFKLCDHCRDLQRERLRRWQKKAKEKQGVCRRCGYVIPVEQQKYVLCPQCRRNLRMRKASRAAQGKCVHCSGPINLLIVGEDADGNGRSQSVVGATYKLCQRCRENDKIRRTNLERMGNCNRCAKALPTEEQGCHKVCLKCRQKKKKIGSVSLHSGFPGVPSMVAIDGMQGVPQKNVVPMNYVPVDQSLMVGSTSVSLMVVGGHMSQQENVPPYTQVISLLDMYKAQLE